MPFLASDVMDGSRIFLNDVGASFYTNDTLLPYLREVNKELERKLVVYDQSIQRVLTANPILVAAGITSIGQGTFGWPTDFLVPNSVHERNSGASDQSWIEMTPKYYEPENAIPADTFGVYTFRNNKIYFPPSTVNKDILLKYERTLVPITSQNTVIDSDIMQLWMSARLAEMAARYIGMNSDHADELALREVGPKEDDLERILILTDQHNRGRRRRFRTQVGQLL